VSVVPFFAYRVPLTTTPPDVNEAEVGPRAASAAPASTTTIAAAATAALKIARDGRRLIQSGIRKPFPL